MSVAKDNLDLCGWDELVFENANAIVAKKMEMGAYDAAVTLCAVAEEYPEWFLLLSGGWFFIASLIDTSAYQPGNNEVRCCRLSEESIPSALSKRLIPASPQWRRVAVDHGELPVYDILGDRLISTGTAG